MPFSSLLRPLALLSLVALTGCASSASTSDAASYRVIWSAARATDKAPLAASSLAVRMGGGGKVKTGQGAATEDRPSITEFSASLRQGARPGFIEVTSRAVVRELIRTPKGKLVRQKRTIGSLLPMRSGERQNSSSSGEPIAVTVELERAPVR